LVVYVGFLKKLFLRKVIYRFTYYLCKMNKSAKKIVIFDDDEDILSICVYILEEQGWEVYTYTNCNNIVERISEIKPDVILMDNWIPDEGGIIATQILK